MWWLGTVLVLVRLAWWKRGRGEYMYEGGDEIRRTVKECVVPAAPEERVVLGLSDAQEQEEPVEAGQPDLRYDDERVSARQSSSAPILAKLRARKVVWLDG